MRTLFRLTGIALLFACGTARAETTPFDGDWKLAVICPSTTENEGAKGYSYYFNGQVAEGHLQMVHGTAGEPGWQALAGDIAPDGAAHLTLDGIVNMPDHAIGNSPRGKHFTYQVLAKFEKTSGSGERTSGRVCNFRFTR